jgi:apolipoprotein D and lipocalin family protein
MHRLDEAQSMKIATYLASALTVMAACFAPAGVSAQVNTQASAQPLNTVPSINITRYQGTWHQLALYPNRFQQSCASNTSATYSLLPDGHLQVLNECRGADGKPVQALGVARPAKAAKLVGQELSPPQLEVRFAPAWLAWLPMVWGNYWVIQLANDERYAVIGEPKREYLWVLARDTQVSAADWLAIESRLKEQGYDPAKLVRERHLP